MRDVQIEGTAWKAKKIFCSALYLIIVDTIINLTRFSIFSQHFVQHKSSAIKLLFSTPLKVAKKPAGAPSERQFCQVTSKKNSFLSFTSFS